jgi:glutathione synthase/RimK-type ligase-like ATP-grasp enzyme
LHKKEILVLTHAKDDCAALVIEDMRRRGTQLVRFDTETFHTGVKLSLRLRSDGIPDGGFAFPDRLLRFEQIGAVWNRRVHEPVLESPPGQEPEFLDWMLKESMGALHMAFSMFDCPVVNPWEINERLKFNKMLQMRRAAQLGFEIPDSCVVDDPEDIQSFWKEVRGDVIFKKIRKGLFFLKDGKRILLHTSKIPAEKQTAASAHRMRFTPIFMQRHIPKRFDIRSVVVGDRVFSIAIHSQDVERGQTDYRTAAVHGLIHDMPHEIIDLGYIVNRRLVEFTRSFGLTFGAIDLVMTPDDRIVFLEDNPNGQWAWLQHKTGAPISAAITDLLCELRDGRRQAPLTGASASASLATSHVG